MLREERAIRVAIGSSVLGAGLKLGVGMYTGSMAMVSSAVDSLGDIIISVANLFVVRIAEEAPDEDHNYGHGKIEGVGAMFEGGFIGAGGLFILYGAVQRLLTGAPASDPGLGILVMLPVLAMTFGVVHYMRKVARETGSLVVKADALHYATDIWMNLGVLASLVLVKLTNRPEIDGVMSIGIAAVMLKGSFGVVREGFDVIMDRSLEPEVVAKVCEVFASTPGVRSFHDVRTRGGKHPHVDAHLVVPPEMTAQQLHDMHLDVQARVRAIVGPATKVLLHADTEDDTGVVG